MRISDWSSDVCSSDLFAFLYNAIGVPIAAGVLYPVFGLLLSPMIAALAMSLSSVSVVGNALRLAKTRLPDDARPGEPGTRAVPPQARSTGVTKITQKPRQPLHSPFSLHPTSTQPVN